MFEDGGAPEENIFKEVDALAAKGLHDTAILKLSIILSKEESEGRKVNIYRRMAMSAGALRHREDQEKYLLQALQSARSMEGNNTAALSNCLYNLASYLSEFDRAEEAIALLYEARDIDPQNHRIPFGLAVCLKNMRRYADAVKFFEQMTPEDVQRLSKELRIQPYEYYEHYAVTLLHADNGDITSDTARKAVNALSNAVRQGSLNPDVYYYLGCCLKLLGRIEKAAEIWGNILERQGKEWEGIKYDASKKLAEVYSQNLRRPADAIRILKDLLEVCSDDFQIHQGLAQSYRLSGENEKAEYHWCEALRCLPRVIENRDILNLAFLNERATCLGAMGRFEEARQIFMEVLDINRDDVWARIGFARTLYDIDKSAAPQAEALMRDVLLFDHQNPMVHCKLGVLLKDIGRVEEAAEFFRQTFDLEGTNIELLLNIKECFLALGKYGEAEEVLKEAAGKFPSDPRPPLEFGRIFLDRGDTVRALYSFRTAVELGGGPEAQAGIEACHRDKSGLVAEVTAAPEMF